MTPTVARLPLLFCGLVAVAVAQPSASPTNPGTGKRERPLSRAASDALSAGYKYSPPPPAPAEPGPEVDLREVDRPRNEIIRLPKHVVEGQRPPVFSERSLYSARALRQLAVGRYLPGTLNAYQIGKTGQVYATQMYLDDERLRNMDTVNEHIYLYRTAGEDARADAAQKDYYSTFLRRNDAGANELSKWSGQRY
jgi:hypothetical protein